jgi:hypothetical protein
MTYWVYENWIAEDKAAIHAGSCGLCMTERAAIRIRSETRMGAGLGRLILSRQQRTPPERQSDQFGKDTRACERRGERK